jgi:hypothetical protein
VEHSKQVSRQNPFGTYDDGEIIIRLPEKDVTVGDETKRTNCSSGEMQQARSSLAARVEVLLSGKMMMMTMIGCTGMIIVTDMAVRYVAPLAEDVLPTINNDTTRSCYERARS